MFVKVIETFLEAFEKKFQPKKSGVLSEYSNPILSFIFFQNLIFFQFSWHKICLMRRAVTAFFTDQRTRLSRPFKYLEHVRQANEKVSSGIWKKLRFWKIEAQSRAGIFWQDTIFWIETFFQRPLENFYELDEHVQRIWTFRISSLSSSLNKKQSYFFKE